MGARDMGVAEETRVLVVEDDRGIAESLVRGLQQVGYAVEGVRTGRAALSAPSPDVVLLDLGLPDIDGVEVCRRLRARSDAAIIAVTARGEEADRVVALDEGADDYLVKPFGLAELLARIRAVLRRRRPTEPEILRHGPLALDLRTRKVSVDGHVRVQDDGPGMSAEAKDVAFHRFGNPEARGTGLGLAIVHRLVTSNGGTVRLEDTPGGGLTVVLDLPLRPEG